MKLNFSKALIAPLTLLSILVFSFLTFADTFAIGNSAFTDVNFYACVVKQFNALYPGEITVAANPSDTVLTDAQLAKMEFLNCSRDGGTATWSVYYNMPSYYELNGPKMTSASGLEKMTGLKSVMIRGQELSSIDLSKNINLTELILNKNGLTQIDLSKNIKLTHIIIDEELTSFYEPNLTELTSLNLRNNELSSIDVSKNKKLVSLLLDNGNERIKNIDLSQNANFRNLTIDPSNQASVIPYVEISQTDDCKLAVKIPMVGKVRYNKINNSSYYTFDENTSVLTIKKKPIKDLINSGYMRTVQTATEGATDRVYFIVLPDSVYTAYDQLSSCVPKSSEENIPVPDTSAGGNGVKTPDTGVMTSENNGKLISISLLALGAVVLFGYIAYYIYNRQKNHIRF